MKSLDRKDFITALSSIATLAQYEIFADHDAEQRARIAKLEKLLGEVLDLIAPLAMHPDDAVKIQEANARLIAAAPEMYLALSAAQRVLFLLGQEVRALGCGAPEVYGRVVAALEKAGWSDASAHDDSKGAE